MVFHDVQNIFSNLIYLLLLFKTDSRHKALDYAIWSLNTDLVKLILTQYKKYDTLRRMLLDGDKDGDSALSNACDYGLTELAKVKTKIISTRMKLFH